MNVRTAVSAVQAAAPPPVVAAEVSAGVKANRLNMIVPIAPAAPGVIPVVLFFMNPAPSMMTCARSSIAARISIAAGCERDVHYEAMFCSRGVIGVYGWLDDRPRSHGSPRYAGCVARRLRYAGSKNNMIPPATNPQNAPAMPPMLTPEAVVTKVTIAASR